MDFDLIVVSGKDGAATGGAEMAVFVGIRVAGESNSILSENGGGIKQRAVMFSAIEAMADADAQGRALGCKADGTAKAPCGVRLYHGLLIRCVGQNS